MADVPLADIIGSGFQRAEVTFSSGHLSQTLAAGATVTLTAPQDRFVRLVALGSSSTLANSSTTVARDGVDVMTNVLMSAVSLDGTTVGNVTRQDTSDVPTQVSAIEGAVVTFTNNHTSNSTYDYAYEYVEYVDV